MLSNWLFPVLLLVTRVAGQQTDLPLGAVCTTDSDCDSSKCWPEYWTYGNKICSPSPVGHACSSDDACITGICTDSVCAQGSNQGTHDCYTTADCVTDQCLSPYQGSGSTTQCYPASTGSACTTANADYCVSGVCDADSSGNGNCAAGAAYTRCYDAGDCQSGLTCDEESIEDPLGICYPVAA